MVVKYENCSFCENEFNAEIARKGMTKSELAAKLGISEVTLYRKIKKGGSFSRSEVETLMKIFGKQATINFLYSN